METGWIDPYKLFTPERLDLIIKRRLFSSWINGNDDDADLIYLRHIAARAGATEPLSSYLPKARRLFVSLQIDGFEGDPVPLNRNGKLLDGAHRTAATAALNIPLQFARFDTDHSWPAWGVDWFRAHGMAAELAWILKDFTAYQAETRKNAETHISRL